MKKLIYFISSIFLIIACNITAPLAVPEQSSASSVSSSSSLSSTSSAAASSSSSSSSSIAASSSSSVAASSSSSVTTSSSSISSSSSASSSAFQLGEIRLQKLPGGNVLFTLIYTDLSTCNLFSRENSAGNILANINVLTSGSKTAVNATLFKYEYTASSSLFINGNTYDCNFYIGSWFPGPGPTDWSTNTLVYNTSASSSSSSSISSSSSSSSATSSSSSANTNGVDPASDAAAISKYSGEGKTLVWSDEFNGASVNTAKWNYDTSANGNNNNWGTGEIQWHTDRPENSFVSNGSLVIQARAESYAGRNYTAARLHTHNKGAWKYGKIEARMKLPANDSGVTDAGMWPAFWMLGDNFNGWDHNTLYGGTTGWPHCGEIDIMEVGGAGAFSTLHGTIHYQAASAYNYLTGTITQSGMYSSYHIYGITWTASSIIWTYDGTTFSTKSITPADMTEFHQKFFILFNFAIDGNMGGTPNPANYPQKFFIDWVRVYQ